MMLSLNIFCIKFLGIIGIANFPCSWPIRKLLAGTLIVFMAQNYYVLQLCTINNQYFKYIPDTREEYRQVQEEICTFQTSFLTRIGITFNLTVRLD